MLHIRTALLLPFGLKPNTQEWLFDPHPPSLVELPAGAHRDEVVREALRCAPGTLEVWDSSRKRSALLVVAACSGVCRHMRPCQLVCAYVTAARLCMVGKKVEMPWRVYVSVNLL